MSNPKVITYWCGRFRPALENWPDNKKTDKEFQAKVLILTHNRFSYYNWNNTLPKERFEEINNYVYDLLREFY